MATSHKHTTLYADCFSGISGDMFVGALLNAGLPFAKLRDDLALLGLQSYEITSTADLTNSIAATNFSVVCTEKPHTHRKLQDIHNLITASPLAEGVKQTALRIFTTLAEAEATVHGTTMDKIHFHEVGAIDSIIDIVGAAIGLDYFRVGACTCSPLPMPSGWVHCDHGQLPLPAPAVSELSRNMPVFGVDLKTELVTPTGAAIIKTIAADFGPMPKMVPAQVGYGAGKKKLPGGQPNLLRLIIGQPHANNQCQEVVITETNLDDWSPERVPYLYEKLFERGALDVVVIPIQMKKSRPGFTVQVISSPADAWELQKILLSETSAIGLRFRKEQRWTLPREYGVIPSQWGEIKVKLIQSPSGARLTPEYEECRRIAIGHALPLDTVYNEIQTLPLDTFKPTR
jgi:hypothetical protein